MRWLNKKIRTPRQARYQGSTDGKPSISTYDTDTDDNIFALGDAASQLDDLDDLFSGFGFDLKELLHGDGEPGTVTRQKFTVGTNTDGSKEGTPVREGSEDTASMGSDTSQKTVQVSTISKKMPGGKSVHTRLIQGPVRCTKRIMKIHRDGPNGPELIAEIEAPPDGDINKAIQSALPAALTGDRAASGDYDNVAPNFQAGTPKPSSRESTPPVNDHTPLIKPPSIDEPKPATKPQVQFQTEPQTPAPETKPHGFFRGRRPSLRPQFGRKQSLAPPASPTNLLPGAPSPDRSPDRKRDSLAEDEAIQVYKPGSPTLGDGEDVHDEDNIFHCLKCTKLCKRGAKKAVPKSFSDKGKSGMTASEINAEDKALPGPQALIANYARMLYEKRPQFVETMFRAVKLNKLDVTRILSKIVHKSGIKLSDETLREPESSATILHVALLYNHVAIVDFLLQLGDRDLILASYETDEYKNQTGLHVAVANGNPVIVEKLVLALEEHDRPTLINTIATGHYFRTQHPHGQLCLTAAAWAGNGQVIKTLVKHHGQLALKNNFGNTLLHSLILQSAAYPERNDYESLFTDVWEASEIWADQMVYETKNPQQRMLQVSQTQVNLFKQLLNIRNNDGYTPLALAASINSRLYQTMINLEKIYKIPQNRLGSIAWVTYDVTDITSFANSKYNKYAVLHILAHNSAQLSRHASLEAKEKDEDFLELEPVKALITCKWAVYRWIYIMWFIIHLSYMVIFTATTAETNSSPIKLIQPHPIENNNISLRNGIYLTRPHMGYAFFVILPIVYQVVELLDLFGNIPYRVQYMTGQNYAMRLVKTVKSEWTITGNGPYRLVGVGFAWFTIQWFFLYINMDENQDVALSMSLLLGWIFVLFFTRGCRVTCRFSIMIQKMFFRDLIYFLTVYGIVLIAFSFAMNAMFTYQGSASTTINTVFYDMMNVVTDLDQKQSIDEARHLMFAKLLLILYAIFSVILLMNMLIAMMNTSYETVRVTRCNLWRQQQLSIMLMIERRFFWCKWLCRKSERDIWKKESDNGLRSYLDVTMLHTPSYKCV